MIEPRQTDELPPEPRRFPWPKALLIGLGVLVLAGLIVYVNSRGSAEQELRELLAELDEREPGWRFEQLHARRPHVPDEQNAALVVIAFKKLMPKEWWRDQEVLDENKPTDPRQPPTPEQLAVMQKKLQEATAALAEARKLAGYTTGRFPIKYNPDMLSTLLPDSQECRTVTRLLGFDLQTRLSQGDVEGALVNVQASLGAARAHGDEPITIAQIIRMATRMEACRQLERLLAHGELTDPALAYLQAELIAEERFPILETAARAERAMAFAALQAVNDGDPRARQMVEHLLNVDRQNHSFMEESQYWFLLGGVKRDQIALLRRSTRFLAITREPLQRLDELVRELDQKNQQMPLLARQLAGFPWKNLWQSHLRGQAELRCAIVMVAVERYRLKHGRWPGQLSDLEDESLGQAALDPYTGRPLFFKQTEEGVVMWSVGPDRADDGGRPLDGRRQLDENNKGDCAFRLFDVAKRGPLTPQAVPPE